MCWLSLQGLVPSSPRHAATWTEATTSAQLHSVTCVAQDVRPGNTSTWYYGTGEYHGNTEWGYVASYLGDGIYRSTDNGVTWSVLPSTSVGHPQYWDSNFDYVWDIAIDPSNTLQTILYAALPGGIYKSTNGGTTWESGWSTSQRMPGHFMRRWYVGVKVGGSGGEP